MNPFLTSVFGTIGACLWIYTKLQNKSGRNTQQSIAATVASGLIIFVVLLIILGIVF